MNIGNMKAKTKDIAIKNILLGNLEKIKPYNAFAPMFNDVNTTNRIIIPLITAFFFSMIVSLFRLLDQI